PNGVALACHALNVVADVDVVIARGEICACVNAQGSVVAAAVVVKERTLTVGRVVAAGEVHIERSLTVGRVSVAGEVGNERTLTVGRVSVAGGVATERKKTTGGVPAAGVPAAGGVLIERKRANGRVAKAGGVKDQRVGSNGHVFIAGGVVQERCRAHCGIGIPVVESQRSSAKTGIVAAGGIHKKRIPTKPCVSSPAAERMKRIASFRCGEPGIAPVRGRSNLRRCLHLWQQCKARKRGQDRCEYCEVTSIFHELNFPFLVLAFFDFSSLSCHFWPFTGVQNGNQWEVTAKAGLAKLNWLNG